MADSKKRDPSRSPDTRAPRRRGCLGLLWRWSLRPTLVLVLLVAGLHYGGKAIAALRAAGMSETERLAEDLERLETLLVEVHPAPFRNAARGDVEAAIERARQAVERFGRTEATEEAVLAHFAEAVTRLDDPHTYYGGRYDRFGIVRAAFRLFPSGVRLVGAIAREDLGARVVTIGTTPVSQALERIQPLVAAPNPSGFLADAPKILRSPGLLHHAEVIDDPSEIALTIVRVDGSEAELVLPRITLDAYREERPVRHEVEEGQLPRHRRETPPGNWVETLPGGRAVYLRFARSGGGDAARLGELARDALAAREALPGAPLVVDLRGNPGGDPQSHVDLVASLAASPRGRGPENLRVLVDRGTASAAVVAAGDLERRLGGLVVGEEPADNARLTTDARPFTLAHSKFEVWIPTGRMRTPGGAGWRGRLVPERVATPGYAEWSAGRDPALAAALEPVVPAADAGRVANALPDTNVALAPAAGEADGDSKRGDAAPPEGDATASPAGLPLGRFAYDLHRTLTLSFDGNAVRAEVSGLGSDPLGRRSDGSWAGGIHRGLRAGPEGELEQLVPGGDWEPLEPRSSESALDAAMAGRRGEAESLYLDLTADGSDRETIARLGLPAEGYFRYAVGDAAAGRTLFEIARKLSPADPLIPLQHSLLRRAAEDRLIPPPGDFLAALAACARRYREVELLNDLRICL